MTMNSKEENTEDFCPNYLQEFGLCTCQCLAMMPSQKIDILRSLFMYICIYSKLEISGRLTYNKKGARSAAVTYLCSKSWPGRQRENYTYIR
jgi:hypothetical protein